MVFVINILHDSVYKIFYYISPLELMDKIFSYLSKFLVTISSLCPE